ncbi:TNF receptor-associated factor 2-like [Pseudonaja textilis]|uniref:TNF receptor-associated factor 2-like n=1 Tax=Pseudonaja textilis TaxID=8673 RepID=UPI000EA94EF4|nr:TNF receptor-associated factor 2-like [Pseudonaja textilis]
MMGKLRGSVMPMDPLSKAGLLCQACGFLLANPQQAECGHRYCRRCVKGLFRDSERIVSCLTCKKVLHLKEFHSDKAAENDALDTQVACPNFDCRWTGTLKSYQEHLCHPEAPIGTTKNDTLIPEDQNENKEKETHWSVTAPAMGGPSLNIEAVQLRMEALELMVASLRRQLNQQVSNVKTLQHCCSKYEELLKISQETRNSPHGTKGSGPSTEELVSTDGILIWKVENFSKLLKDAKSGKRHSIFSPAFATHPFGYRLYVRLYPDGDGVGKGGHLSVFLALAKGPYDDILPWPFRQKVTFSLLDPTRRKSPLVETFLPDPHSTSFQQPHQKLNVASGSPLFASHAKIPNYLKDDTLFLKIAVDLIGIDI